MCLASILDNNEVVFASESKYWVHVSGLAVDMDRNDGSHGRLQVPVDEPAGFRVCGTLTLEVLLKFARIHAIRAFIDVNKIGPATGLADRLGGRDKGVGDRNDNIAWLYASGGQRELDRIPPPRGPKTNRRHPEFCVFGVRFLLLLAPNGDGRPQCIPE